MDMLGERPLRPLMTTPHRSLPRIVQAAAAEAGALPVVEPAQVMQHGAILYRGFAVDSIAAFRQAVLPCLGDLLSYAGGVGFKQISPLGAEAGVYASTQVPRHIRISPHSELAYTNAAPRYVAFWCAQPSHTGGETTVVCARRVAAALSEPVRQRFAALGVRYLRRYSPDHALLRAVNRAARVWPSWPMVFETTDPAEVSRICEAQGMTCTWSPRGVLTTEIHRPGLEVDEAGASVWLNQAHTFVPSPAALGGLGYTAARGLRFLPPVRQASATFGDGTAIPQEMLQEICSVLAQATHPVRWQRGDLLVLANRQVLHGRQPFTGPRKLWAAMGQGRTA